MGPAVLISGAVTAAETIFTNLVNRPWRTSTFLLLIYLGFCQTFHNGCGTVSGPCSAEAGDTLSHDVDTILNFDLTPKIFEFDDTIPDTEVYDDRPRWTPPEVDIPVNADCSDSVAELKTALKWASAEIEECDSVYRAHTPIQTHSDSIEEDGYRLVYRGLKIKGLMLEAPEMSLVKLTPDTLIRERTTLLAAPKRKIGVGLETLSRFNMPTRYSSQDFLINAGYMDVKNNVFILKAGIGTDRQWSAGFQYIRFFDTAW